MQSAAHAQGSAAGITLEQHEPFIAADHLVRLFGPTLAVADISLTVRRGELLALLGPNGAGKTTTLQMLAGLLAPSAGRARVAGFDVVKHSKEVRARVGLMVDEPGFYPEMTIDEYLVFMARLYGLESRIALRQITSLLTRFDLGSKRGARLSSLSKGMRQKVALVRALLHVPPVLLLDEPTSALDPLSAQAVHDYIAERRAAGDAIILSTHQLAEAEALADRVVIIAAGRVRRQGTWTDLRRPEDGRDAFVTSVRGIAVPDLLAIARGVLGLHEPSAREETGRIRLAYSTPSADATNGALVAALVEGGAVVLALEPVPCSLRQVYLETLGEAMRDTHGHNISA